MTKQQIEQVQTRNDFGKLLTELSLFGNGVELGVASGRFSDCILKTSKLKILFSVDRWTDHHDYNEYKNTVHMLGKHEGRSVILKMTFDEAAPLFQDEIFDFIYFDGYAHTGQDNGKTFIDWWPKLKDGGIFAGHDYDKDKYPQTVEQVDYFVNKHNLTLHVTNERRLPSWFCQKPVDHL